MTGVVPTLLEDLKRFVEAIGGRWTLVIAMGDPASIDKAGWLFDAGRDFFSVTPAMQAAILSEMMIALRTKLDRRDFRAPETVMVLAAEAARKHILKRFERGGYDVKLTALSPMWLRYKRNNPAMDPRVGIAYGTLYRDVKVRARFSFARVGG